MAKAVTKKREVPTTEMTIGRAMAQARLQIGEAEDMVEFLCTERQSRLETIVHRDETEDEICRRDDICGFVFL